MSNLSNASFSAMLKTLWYSKELMNLALKNNPFLGLVSKNTDFVGDSLKLPLSFADLQGRSASFQDAQANLQPSKYGAFLITRVNDYAVGRIDGETIETAKANKGAFMNAMEAEVKRGRNSITRSLAVAMYRDVNGTIATIVNAVTGTTFEVPIADGYNLEVGMQLNAVDATNTLKAGSMLIVGINRAFSPTTAQITVNTTTGITPGLVATDTVCVVGDFGAKLTGLAGWIPDTSAQANTTLFGLNRSQDTTRLGGLRLSTSAPIEEAFQQAAAFGYSSGARYDRAFMNPIDFGNFVNGLGAKVMRTKLMGETGVGYSAVLVDTAAGEIAVMPDVNCPRNRIYLLQMDTWTLFSAGDAPHILNYGDGNSLRVGNQDAQEFRLGYRAQLACSAPGYNQVIILTP